MRSRDEELFEAFRRTPPASTWDAMLGTVPVSRDRMCGDPPGLQWGALWHWVPHPVMLPRPLLIRGRAPCIRQHSDGMSQHFPKAAHSFLNFHTRFKFAGATRQSDKSDRHYSKMNGSFISFLSCRFENVFGQHEMRNQQHMFL